MSSKCRTSHTHSRTFGIQVGTHGDGRRITGRAGSSARGAEPHDRRLRRGPAAALVLLCAVFWAGEAAAQTTAVSNLGFVGSNQLDMAEDVAYAQGFTTGSASGGYVLHSIQVHFREGTSSPGDLRVQLRGHSTSTGNPSAGVLSVTFTKPSDLGSAGSKTFTAPANTTLSANTTYYILLQYTEPNNRRR